MFYISFLSFLGWRVVRRYESRQVNEWRPVSSLISHRTGQKVNVERSFVGIQKTSVVMSIDSVSNSSPTTTV